MYKLSTTDASLSFCHWHGIVRCLTRIKVMACDFRISQWKPQTSFKLFR